MIMNKRILSLFLACLFSIVALTACSGNGGIVGEDTTVLDTTAVPDSDKWPEVDGTVIYVDASANEGGNGSKDVPYKSISEAQKKIREIKSGEGLPAGGITVLIASGEYDVKDGIVFTGEDSGSESSTIIYMSAEKYGASLSGGIKLNAADFVSLTDDEKAKLNDETAKDAVVKLDLTKYGITSEDIGNMYSCGRASKDSNIGSAELFIDENRMTISRYPNVGNLKTGINDGDKVFELEDASKEEVRVRTANWDLDKVWVSGYFFYGWADANLALAKFDVEKMEMTLSKSINYGIAEDANFYYHNIFAETDMPGEYYIDRENLVLYLYPTENFDSSSIVFSVSDKDIITATDLSYVTFSGLSISATRANGIVASGNNIKVDNCKIFGIRANAMDITGNDIKIENNEICQVGHSGIKMTGGVAETLSESGNIVYNNYIHHWGQIGRTYEGAVNLYGCGNTVSHNEFHDAPHMAISWDGPLNIMEYNKVYNVCFETDDCGAFYEGRSFGYYGSEVKYNLIYNVGSGTAVANGIYFDDALSGQTAYGNIIVNTTGFGIVIGGGRDNVVENNLLIDCGTNSRSNPIIYASRAREGMLGGKKHWFYRIIIEMPEVLIQMQTHQEWLDRFPGYGDIIPYYEGYEGDRDNPMLSPNPANNIIRMNMFYYTGDYTQSIDMDYQVMKMGTVEENYTIRDKDLTQIPGYNYGNYSLSDNADAYQYGFEKLPYDKMGRVTEE